MTSLPQKLVEMLKHQGTGAVFTNTEMWFRWRKPQIQTVTKHLFLKRFTAWQKVIAQRHPPSGCCGQSVWAGWDHTGSPPTKTVATRGWGRPADDIPSPSSRGSSCRSRTLFPKPDHPGEAPIWMGFSQWTIWILASPADVNGRLKKLLRLESGDISIAGLSFTSMVSYLDILFQFFQEHLFVVVIDINLLALINEIIIL